MRVEKVIYSYDSKDEYESHSEEMRQNEFIMVKATSSFDKDIYLEVEYQNIKVSRNKIYGKVINT